jgi:hypothetical protein
MQAIMPAQQQQVMPPDSYPSSCLRLASDWHPFLLPAAGAATIAHACTSGGYADPKGYISWRLLDLPKTYFNNLAFVPAGMQMQVSAQHTL